MSISVNPLSVSVCPIAMLCNDHRIGNATGFFYRSNQGIFLVSNWHVFSGRDPRSGQPKHPDGPVPDSFMIEWHDKQNLSRALRVVIRLTDDDDKPLWIQHKVLGQDVDIAAYKLSMESKSDRNFIDMVNCVNDQEMTNLAYGVSQDVFVLGYPRGLMKTLLMPIWKRASIASEVQLTIDGKPSFLIDTATREGMSGSPVMRVSHGLHLLDDGSAIQNTTMAVRFLGVYSGRHIGEIDEAQLGIVWHRSLIDQLLSGLYHIEGSYELRKT